MAKKQRVGGKKSKSPDTRPARVRYWAGRHLERNKVNNLMKRNGWDEKKSLAHWHRVRTTRVVDGFIPRIAI